HHVAIQSRRSWGSIQRERASCTFDALGATTLARWWWSLGFLLMVVAAAGACGVAVAPKLAERSIKSEMVTRPSPFKSPLAQSPGELKLEARVMKSAMETEPSPLR